MVYYLLLSIFVLSYLALVSDDKHFDVTEITVHIDDINDYPPSFHRKQYLVDVIDDTEPSVDELLLTLFAEDRDSGNNGKVSYWISGKLFSTLRLATALTRFDDDVKQPVAIDPCLSGL